MKTNEVRWAILLPLAELAVWSALVVWPALFMYVRLYELQMQGGTSTGSGRFEFSLAMVAERRFQTVVNLNLPGALVGAPLSAPAALYFRSHPGMFSARAWHTVTIPFFCIPAWWFVGLGIDAIFNRKSLHWGFRVIGSILCCACIAMAIGILTSPPNDKKDLLPFMPGTVFWGAAFGLFPSHWLLRRSLRKTDGTATDFGVAG